MTRLTLRFRLMFTPWLALLATLVLLASLAASAQADGPWTTTGSMTNARGAHTATLLNDGRVLVAGGSVSSDGTTLASAEIYDPAAGTWSPIGSMSVVRIFHAAALLDDGRVLVAGGLSPEAESTAEIFDPVTGAWSPTGNMTFKYARHPAARLNDGRILVTGGHAEISGPTPFNKAEIFDPATGTWSRTGDMTFIYLEHTTTLLNDGRVLASGGTDRSELFDPATGTWSRTGDGSDFFFTDRLRHTATLLNDGRVLAAGGWCCNSFGSSSSTDTANLFDPATNTWSPTSEMSFTRAAHTATLLPNGQVLVAGGFYPLSTSNSARDSAELFDPSASPPPPPPPAASITVSAPNGGEVWPVGSTQTIQWTAEGVSGNLKIQISRDGGASYKQIANNVPNTGAFQWMVTKPATTQALIRVLSMEQPEVQDISDTVFSITK